jgi:DNA polymerase III delta prime subunit
MLYSLYYDMHFSDFPAHHALLLTHTDRATYGETLWKEISSQSPAHTYYDQTVLDIETARKIISWAQSPYNDERIALISFHTAGLPAQNAMLKILEEPRQGTRFVLLTSNKENLIDTVLSRVHHIHVNASVSDLVQKTAEEFLATSPSFRMKLSHVVDLLAKIDEEGRKDREAIKGFILTLVSIMQAKKVEPRFITETLEIASYASDPSASGKALLEYLSLLLPQIK